MTFKHLYSKYIDFVVKRPSFMIALSLLFLAMSYPIVKVHFDDNGEGWYPKNSVKLQMKNQFIKDFGSDEMMMYLLTFPDSVTKDRHIEILRKLTDSIGKSIYHFETILSKSNINDIKGIMGEKYASKMEKTYFQSKDSNCEMVFLKVRINKNILKVRPLLIDSLEKVSNAILPKYVKRDLSGQSIIYSEINRLTSEDSVKLFALCFLLVCGLLFWQVRKFSYILICLFLLVLSIIPSLSLFGWLDVPVNMITITVPLLFIINFSSFAIHIITKQTTDVKRYIDKKIPPIITSAVATIIGFGSLATSNIHIISEFGILTAAGILIGLFTFLLIGVPLVVRLIQINHLVIKSNWLNQILDRYYLKINKTYSYITLGILSIVLILSIISAFSIKTDTNMINFMKESNAKRQTEKYIESHFGSANVVDFLVIKKNNGKLDNDDFRLLADVNKQIATLPFIKSVAGYDLWRPFINEMQVYKSSLGKQLKLSFISQDKNRSRFMAVIPLGTVNEMDKMLQSIQTKIDSTTKNSTIEIKPVGFLPLFVEQLNTVVNGMLSGLLLAIVLIQIVISLLVRDIKLGFLTLIVTVCPLSGIALVMKLLNIPFDIGTSIISSVVIGMIADDAIHIVWNYKRRIKRIKQLNLPKENESNLFADSIRKIVFPCTATSIMFSFGFIILVFSNMVTIIYFGIICTATIILAWISDFMIFPTLIKLFYRTK